MIDSNDIVIIGRQQIEVYAFPILTRLSESESGECYLCSRGRNLDKMERLIHLFIKIGVVEKERRQLRNEEIKKIWKDENSTFPLLLVMLKRQ